MDDALDVETDDDDDLSTEREVIALLAQRTWLQRSCTVAELHRAIDVLIDSDLDQAQRRVILIEAIAQAWHHRLKGRAPTKDEFNQAIDDIIRAVGDDRTYGLRKPRRIRSTKRKAAIISLVPPAREDGDEDES